MSLNSTMSIAKSQAISRALQSLRWRTITLSLLCAAGLCAVTNVPAAAKAKDPLTVLAMLKAETDYLAQWQAKQRKVAARKRPAPALLSIYGVLPALRASVLVNGHEVVFAQGQSRPLTAYSQHTGRLRLRYIKPPCVSFVHGARRRTLCLPKAGS